MERPTKRYSSIMINILLPSRLCQAVRNARLVEWVTIPSSLLTPRHGRLTALPKEDNILLADRLITYDQLVFSVRSNTQSFRKDRPPNVPSRIRDLSLQPQSGGLQT
jgi:hypothetical protein